MNPIGAGKQALKRYTPRRIIRHQGFCQASFRVQDGYRGAGYDSATWVRTVPEMRPKLACENSGRHSSSSPIVPPSNCITFRKRRPPSRLLVELKKSFLDLPSKRVNLESGPEPRSQLLRHRRRPEFCGCVRIRIWRRRVGAPKEFPPPPLSLCGSLQRRMALATSREHKTPLVAQQTGRAHNERSPPMPGFWAARLRLVK